MSEQDPPIHGGADGVLLDDIDWPPLVVKLLKLASSALARMYWRGGRGGVAPGGMGPEDFVQEAIKKTVSGGRRWKQSELDLYRHLADIVLRDINNCARKKENSATVLRDPGQFDLFLAPNVRNPEECLLNKEFCKEVQQWIEAVAEGDALLKKYLEITTGGIGKPVDISKIMGISQSDVYNLRKRAARKMAERKTCDYGRGAVVNVGGLSNDR